MGIIEIIAVIFTLLCVYLTTKENIWCWPVGIVGIAAFLLLFIDAKLYSQVGLQFIFLFQSFYGWFMWSRADGNELKVTRIKPILQASTFGITILAGFLFGFYLHTETDGTLPYLDSFSAAFSVLATFYLAKKYLEAWHIWMCVNILLFITFIIQQLYLSAGLEVVLFILSIKGFSEWTKNIKTDSV